MTAGQGPPALAADHLCRRFRGLTAVADVSLRVAPGARFGIIGPNGAGKTTLFNLLSGELRPTSGSVALFGRDITALRPYRRVALGLGRTFQITGIFSDLTVLENLTLALHGLSPTKLSLLRPWRSYRGMTAEAAALAASFGLAERLASPASDLSHGEERELEVLLARALTGRAGRHPGAADIAAGRTDPDHDRARHRRPARGGGFRRGAPPGLARGPGVD